LTKESTHLEVKHWEKIFATGFNAGSNHPKKINGCVSKQKKGLTGSDENRCFFRYSGMKATTFLCPLALKNSTTILMPFTEKTFMCRPWLIATLLPSITTGRNPDRGCELLPTEKKRYLKKPRISVNKLTECSKSAMFLLVKTVIEHSGSDLLNQGLCRQQIVEIFL
jgi:hypothetical protein